MNDAMDQSQSSEHESKQKLSFFKVTVTGLAVAVAVGVARSTWRSFRRRKKLSLELEKTVVSGYKRRIDDLLERGANVNFKNAEGLTMRMLARKNGMVDVAEHLEAKGARTDIPVPYGNDACDRIMKVKSSQAKTTNGSLVTLVAKDGKVLYEKAVGYSDRFSRTKATLDTMYCVGSVTKQFVAAAILKLEEQGKLRVSDKLAKYYPEFAHGKAAEVTIHHLLTHTSGIHTYISVQFLDRIVNELVDANAVTKEIAEIPLDFEPGEKFLYSNSGYMFLGRLCRR